jgi:hypothetical protein
VKENAMPRITELLGFAAVAVGGTLTAIALAPTPSGAFRHGAHAVAPATTAAAQPSAAPVIRLPSVEVVGRRSVEPSRIEVARQHLQKGTTRPNA